MAKHVVTLDHLSGGRAVLGVGLGEPPTLDFADLGEEADPRIRAAMLDESLEIIDALVSGRAVDHDGEHFHARGSLRPASVQRPRVPVWVAGIAPHRRPLERARCWDGYVPIGPGLEPEALAGLVGPPPRAGWDLVVPWADGVPADEYADAGVTWLVRSTWPKDENWLEELVALAGRPPTMGG